MPYKPVSRGGTRDHDASSTGRFESAAACANRLSHDLRGRVAVEQGGGSLPSTAIVFTGQYDRIHRGLDLLDAGEIEWLFISGVNQKAGGPLNRFERQFRLTPDQKDLLAQGRIILSPNAQSTIENALEAACWLEDHPASRDARSVTLITSQRHMARASLSLRRAISPKRVVRVVSDPPEKHLGLLENLTELRKFLLTGALTSLPRRFWPVGSPATCRTD